MMLSLTSEQRRFLRAQAHNLNPVVTIGDAGLTEAFRVTNGNVLGATVAMMDQRVAIRLPGVQSLLQGIQNEAGSG